MSDYTVYALKGIQDQDILFYFNIANRLQVRYREITRTSL